MKSGFVSVIGRTNAGKSSLINSLLDEKITLVSHKQNATRRKINAIIMHKEDQIIFTDTPGLHQSEKLFNQMLINSALKSIEGVDLVLFVLSVKEDFSEYERFLALSRKAPHILLLNKVDLLDKERLFKKLEALNAYSKEFASLMLYSSKQKTYKKPLLDEIVKFLPEHEYFFDKSYLTNTSEKEIYKDFILEAIFESFSDEVPYHCEVQILKFKEQANSLLIEAQILSDTNSHKAMLIGKDGLGIKRLGIKARKKIENFAQKKVFLKLFVKIHKSWQNDKDFLQRMLNE